MRENRTTKTLANNKEGNVVDGILFTPQFMISYFRQTVASDGNMKLEPGVTND